jgi:hypothetical protein
MINTNDLIGLQYGWGHAPDDGSGKTDCFQLVCEIRHRIGLGDYRKQFDWVYDVFDETTLHSSRIARWLLQNGKRSTDKNLGRVGLLPGNAGAALCTIMGDGTVMYIAPSKAVVRTPIAVKHTFKMNK